MVQILPMMEQTNLFNAYNFNRRPRGLFGHQLDRDGHADRDLHLPELRRPDAPAKPGRLERIRRDAGDGAEALVDRRHLLQGRTWATTRRPAPSRRGQRLRRPRRRPADGQGIFWRAQMVVPIAAVTDGTSNTLLTGEALPNKCNWNAWSESNSSVATTSHPDQPEGQPGPGQPRVLLRLQQQAPRRDERRLLRRLGPVPQGDDQPPDLHGHQHPGRLVRSSAPMPSDRTGTAIPLDPETSSMRFDWTRAAALAATFLVTAWGCGSASEHPETVPVEGKVTYKGAPVPKGTISFLSDGGEVATGEHPARRHLQAEHVRRGRRCGARARQGLHRGQHGRPAHDARLFARRINPKTWCPRSTTSPRPRGWRPTSPRMQPINFDLK